MKQLKRCIAVLLTAMVLLSLAACGNKQEPSADELQTEVQQEPQEVVEEVSKEELFSEFSESMKKAGLEAYDVTHQYDENVVAAYSAENDNITAILFFMDSLESAEKQFAGLTEDFPEDGTQRFGDSFVEAELGESKFLVCMDKNMIFFALSKDGTDFEVLESLTTVAKPAPAAIENTAEAEAASE